MGVDYYACDSCGESRYSEYVDSCNSCGSNLCTYCLVNDDIKDRFAHSYGFRFDSQNPELMKEYAKQLSCDVKDFYDENGEPYWEDEEIIDDSNIQSKYCPFCSGDTINEGILFNFIVEKYKLDINKEWKEYKTQK